MPDPLYRQIADDLRAQIESRQLTPGQRLKSRPELSQVYAQVLSQPVSRNVIRAAVGVLADAGLVETRQGTGTFVAEGEAFPRSSGLLTTGDGESPPSAGKAVDPGTCLSLSGGHPVWRAKIWPWHWRGDTAGVFSMAGQQPYLWLSFFSSQRSTFRGSETVIVAMLIVVTAILLLPAIGDTVPGTLLGLVYAFSALTYFFSVLYWGYGVSPNFSANLTRLDAVYFSVGTLTTAGTGSIAATSELSRELQTSQMALDFVLVVFAVAIVMPRLAWQAERPAKSDRSENRPAG
jgi:GntR family transcriptional regulator